MSFDIDIRLQRGDHTISAQFNTGPGITALFGPSGIGKTSILLSIAGLLTAETGHIVVNDERLFDARTNVPPQLRHCGFIFQDVRLFPHFSVAANLRYGMKRSRAVAPVLDYDALVDFLGIRHFLDRAPRTLSGGEAQRVAIGRALLSGPRFLLMDEPLTALDAARRNEISALITLIRDRFALPILFVSHDRAEITRLADHIIEMA